MSRPLRVRYLGRLPYRQAWALQRDLLAQRKANTLGDTLLLLEHDPVITIGRDGTAQNVLAPPALLSARGVEVIETDRGGDATFHGPGQLVAYPILDLRPDWRDLHRLVTALEQIMIDTLADYGLPTTRLPGAPGVWLPDPDRKIGALGVKVSRWITHHGLALNVNTDLTFFSLIVPCGIPNKAVTSLAQELGHRLPLAEVMETLAAHLARTFGRELLDA